MATSFGRKIINRTKRDLAEKALGQALGVLGNNPEKNASYLLAAIDRITDDEKHATVRKWIRNWLEDGNPGREFLGRILKNIHPNVRQRYLARMIVSMFFRYPEIIERCQSEYGIKPPTVMLISPSMRCNFSCKGCYAGSYERKDDMKEEVFDSALSQAEDMGINFFIILGGEPFIYPELLPVLKRHRNSFFQIYTNGSFIDRPMAKTLVEMGNIAPQISINGPAEYTDTSRGKGAFDQAMQTMDILKEEGCVFGFSSLVTRENIDAICSEEWIDLLIDKGALYGWLFLYMPVGESPNMELMPTPEQRNELRAIMRKYRQTKPILPADFWSDGALTGGCIAGGRQYFHINHRGDVEPCIFCHFATHNINDCSLGDALASPFFKSIRDSQPFSYNTLRPCPMIDHPHKMWNIIQENNARATHPGAEKMFTEFEPQMTEYSRGVERLMDHVWDTEDYHIWAAEWMKHCQVPLDHIESRRQEYEASRQVSSDHTR